MHAASLENGSLLAATESNKAQENQWNACDNTLKLFHAVAT
jgi:hypothetical protein